MAAKRRLAAAQARHGAMLAYCLCIAQELSVNVPRNKSLKD
jgi:hypothetical protein